MTNEKIIEVKAAIDELYQYLDKYDTVTTDLQTALDNLINKL